MSEKWVLASLLTSVDINVDSGGNGRAQIKARFDFRIG